MALRFEIKMGFDKRNFDIESLVSDNMDFGVYENSYFLKEGVIGSPTVIFNKEKIGRGVEVDVEDGKLIFDSPVPSTNSDVELLFTLLQKAINLLGAKELVFNEKTIECHLLEKLKDGVKHIHQESLHFLEDVLKDEEQRHILISGAVQVVSISRKEVGKMIESWDEYENYLHQVQKQDLYFATPIFLQNDEGILGFYTLTSGVMSSFPLEKSFLVDTDQIDVSKWGVGFYASEAEEMLGIISYDDFLANVDTTNMLDAERFIVELGADEMKVLVGKYGEVL